MDWALIAAFDYEIRNEIEVKLGICKTTPLSSPIIAEMVMYEEELLERVKQYMLERIERLNKEIKEKEDRLLNAHRK